MRINRIILVDDESVVRLTTSMILKKLGCEVVAFSNGPEAIAYFQNNSNSVDLAIVDSHMPEMSGTELFAALRTINPSLKAVLASGFLDDDEKGAYSHDGFVAMIGKPFHIQELKDLLETL